MRIRWVAWAAIMMGVAGCTAGNSSDSGGGAGSGANTCQPGTCSGCGDCYALCRCSTGSDEATCLQVCGAGTGGSGAGATGGAGGTGAGGSGAGGSGAGGTGGGTAAGTLAAGIRITEVAIYQAVKIPLMAGGGEVLNRNAPVVANRTALLRVFYATDTGWQPREVAARLEIAGAPLQEIVRSVGAGASNDADMQSTFSFDIPAEQMTGGSSYSVSIVERGAGPGGDASGARWPAQGAQGFMVEDARGPLRVVLVPIIVGGFTPDTSGTRVEQYRRRLSTMFPVPSVDITVRQAVNYGGSVSPNGTGWSSALNSLLNLRAQDNPDSRAYYFGLIAPANSVFSYCGGGCVAGLSGVPQAGDDFERGSVGLGFFPSGDSADSPDTMAHELGHALGRQHSACGTNDGPANFPDASGSIVTWGWDPLRLNTRNEVLLAPGTYKDIMGYCDPNWIADITYDRIFDRIAYVNANGYFTGEVEEARQPGRFRVAVIEPDGSASWADTVERRTPPLGEAREVSLVDGAGRALGTVTGIWYPSTHVAGGRLYVREAALVGRPQLASGLRVEGIATTTLELAQP